MDEMYPGAANDARRQEIVERAIQAADRIILDGSNGSVEETDFLTRQVARIYVGKVFDGLASKLATLDLSRRYGIPMHVVDAVDAFSIKAFLDAMVKQAPDGVHSAASQRILIELAAHCGPVYKAEFAKRLERQSDDVTEAREAERRRQEALEERRGQLIHANATRQPEGMEVEIGATVDRQWLELRGGKFYNNLSGSFCDLPTQTFKEEYADQFKRIE